MILLREEQEENPKDGVRWVKAWAIRLLEPFIVVIMLEIKRIDFILIIHRINILDRVLAILVILCDLYISVIYLFIYVLYIQYKTYVKN